MTQTANNRHTADKNTIQNTASKQYPGIIVECYGTLAEITQQDFLGSQSDGTFSGFGGSGS